MRYLITQSLLSSWSRVFDATDSSYEDALADFSAVLQREPREKTRQMEDGIAFETEVYAEAAGSRASRTRDGSPGFGPSPK
ncbi:MAG: hypothetical protein ACLSHU_09825 [Oscillospiraceae bacterium]